MGKRIKTGRVKANRTYSVEELADCVGVRPPAIRQRIKQGLRALVGCKPTLILGEDFKAFEVSRQFASRSPLGPGEIFCLGCKGPRAPALGAVEIRLSNNGNRGIVRALCCLCRHMCVNPAMIPIKPLGAGTE